MRRAAAAAALLALVAAVTAPRGLAQQGAEAQLDLERLVEQLGGQDSAARSRAYSELQRRRDPAMVPLLARSIETFARGGQQYAVYLLRAQPIDVTRTVFRRLLQAKEPYLRVAGAAALTQHREPAAAGKLAAALAATPEDDRLSVLNLVYLVDDQEVFDALLAWLQPDASAAVACGVLRHLARREKGRTAAIQVAARRLRGAADTGVRAAGLAYLAGFDREAGEELAGLLDEQPALFWTVDDLLDTDRRLPPKLVGAMTKALLEPRSRYDITRTAAMLQRQSKGAAVAELRLLLRHEKADYRAAALEALAAIPGGLDDMVLRGMLRGEDVQERIVAADTLRRRDDYSGLAVLIELLPKAGSHRREAVEALAGFRDRSVAPVLLDLLDDPDQSVRQHAWTGLQALMRGLFPYRRFDFARSGYSPQAPSRAAGIATLRAWWASLAN